LKGRKMSKTLNSFKRLEPIPAKRFNLDLLLNKCIKIANAKMAEWAKKGFPKEDKETS